MKKYFYYAMAMLLVVMTACSKDDSDENNGSYADDRGKDNYTDMAVTGGVNDVFLNNDGMLAAEITGYVNVTDELRATIGLAPVLGVELSTNSSFPENNTTKFTTQRLEDNRKFIITATGLAENTTYYYRTFFTDAVFGKTETFTTPSIESAVSKMKIATADAAGIGDNKANVTVGEKNTGVAYTTDASLLTVANLKAVINNHADNGVHVSKSGDLTELASGTTYSYCAYRIIKDYVILGEVKTFTTTGYNAMELAKKMTINASLNESTQMWTATIQSSLESQYPGKTIRYVIKPFMKTSYLDSRYKEIQLQWIYGGTGHAFEAYATGSGGRYQATLENPFYNATYGIDEYGVEHYFEDCWNLWWESDQKYYTAFELLKDAVKRIKNGDASIGDYRTYSELSEYLENFFDNFPQYDSYVKNYLRIFVEIDGKQYMVKEQEGKLRVPTFKDNPFYDYADIAID